MSKSYKRKWQGSADCTVSAMHSVPVIPAMSPIKCSPIPFSDPSYGMDNILSREHLHVGSNALKPPEIPLVLPCLDMLMPHTTTA